MLPNKEIFNKIAGSWYGYRHHTRFRKELDELSHRWNGGNLLNAGCGHGPDFIPFINKFNLFGCDYSVEMLRYAKLYAQKNNFCVNLVLADLIALPFKSESFDYAIAIATYHHIKSDQMVIKAFSELFRILKNGGEAFITVWNRDQPRFSNGKKETYVPWKTKKETYLRYYRLYTYNELKNMLESVGFRVINLLSSENCFKKPNHLDENICVLLTVNK